MRKLWFLLLVCLLLTTCCMADTYYTTTNDGSAIAKIDTNTGTATIIGPTGSFADYGLAMDPAGKLFTLVNSYNNAQLASVNSTTGAATVYGVPVGLPNMMVMEFAPDGSLYTASWTTNQLYKMNVATGQATLIGNLGFGGVMDFAFDTNGKLFGIAGTGLWQIDPLTGASTLAANFSGTDGCVMGIAFDTSNTLYGTSWCSGNSPLYKLDIATQSASIVGYTGLANPHGGDIFTAVPEPGTMALLGTGLFGFALRRFRKV